MTKECKICKVIKLKSEFPSKGNKKIRSECKECFSLIQKNSYEKRKNKEKIIVEVKNCTKCKIQKPISEFRKHPSNKDGYDSSCKSCMSEYYKSDVIKSYLNKKKQSGKQSEILKKYREIHKLEIQNRKKSIRNEFNKYIKIAEKKVREEFRTKVHEIMGGKCTLCDENRTSRLCIDHINNNGSIERLSNLGSFRSIASKIINGYNWKDEYQLLCFNCNRKKQIEYLKNLNRNHEPEIKDTKMCSQCKKMLPLGLFVKSDRPHRISYCKYCGNNYAKKRKIKVLEKLGGKCSICGETDFDVLEIDHIENNGSEKRKNGEDKSITLKIYSEKRETKDLQVLCANCNADKEYQKEKVIKTQPNVFIKQKVDLVEFNFKEIEIKKSDRRNSYDFLQKYHYAGFGRSEKSIYSAMIHNEIIAVAKFSTIVRKEVATSLNLSHNETIELDRFCINPKFQKKNLASYVLSRITKLIEIELPNINLIVSFADTEQGHQGIIYLACGWEKIGVTQKSHKYIDENMHIINKKTLYERAKKACMTEKEYAEKNKFKKVKTPEKIKFVKWLNKHEKVRRYTPVA